MNSIIRPSEYQAIFDQFKIRFYQGMDQEECKSGKRPSVCIMPESDFVALRLMAHEMTFIKQFSRVEQGTIQFIGVDCFESSTVDRMVFGCRHEN